jgi:pimeloyl-ACP methyl ester carboxylesterase
MITASDGVRIALRDGGNADGVPVIFLHGIAQSHRAWDGVFRGPLAVDTRLIAYDLRGHGDSDKPQGDERYASGNRLGEDLFDVVQALKLDRPILVAWSYGGVVVGEYLRAHGDGDLGGILFWGAALKIGKPARGLLGPVMLENGRALMSDDDAIYDAASRTFVAGCAGSPIDGEILDDAVLAMKKVPPHVRRALLTRSEDFSEEIARATVPMTMLYGSLDRVILPAMMEAIAPRNPLIEKIHAENVGHLAADEAPKLLENAVRALVSRRQSAR